MNTDLVLSKGVEAPIIVLRAETLDRVAKWRERIDTFEVKDDFDLVVADEMFTTATAMLEEIEKQRQILKAPVLELGRAIDGAVRPTVDTLTMIRSTSWRKAKLFRREQRRIAEEEARKEAEERARLEAEQKAKEPAQEPQGGPIPATPAPAPAPVAIVAPAASQAYRTRTIKVLQIDDVAQIPAEIGGVRLLLPDEAAIERLMRAGVAVPGCRMIDKEVPVKTRSMRG